MDILAFPQIMAQGIAHPFQLEPGIFFAIPGDL